MCILQYLWLCQTTVLLKRNCEGPFGKESAATSDQRSELQLIGKFSLFEETVQPTAILQQSATTINQPFDSCLNVIEDRLSFEANYPLELQGTWLEDILAFKQNQKIGQKFPCTDTAFPHLLLIHKNYLINIYQSRSILSIHFYRKDYIPKR